MIRISAHVLSALAALVLSLTSLSACRSAEAPGKPPARSDAPPRSELLRVGATAPEFSAIAHNGTQVALSSLRGKVVILYFYPKDGTPGCTEEARGFEANYTALQEKGAVVVGVSTDDNGSHREFAEDLNLAYLLLPDTERQIARAYGVGSLFGMTHRVTYLIDRDGRILRVYDSVDPSKHAEEILQTISQ